MRWQLAGMHRRAFLTVLGSGSLALAGCLSETDPAGSDGTPEGTDQPGTDQPDDPDQPETDTPDTSDQQRDLPEECPTSQDLGVEWPEELDAATVASFVENYEQVYYREVVVEYDPDTEFSSYELSGSVRDQPEKAGDGWILEYSGSGGVYRPDMLLGATPSEPPADADVVSIDDIDDDTLRSVAREAAQTGEADLHVTSEEDVVRYNDLLAGLSEDFEPLESRGDSDSLSVAVDGSHVELSARVTSLHGDYWWDARYYVDEHVVRRTEDDIDPRNGELLECRQSG
jgi:hypothetical protein